MQIMKVSNSAKSTPKAQDKLSNVMPLPRTAQIDFLQKHLCAFLWASIKTSNYTDTYSKAATLQISISDSCSWIEVTNEK